MTFYNVVSVVCRALDRQLGASKQGSHGVMQGMPVNNGINHYEMDNIVALLSLKDQIS